MPAFIDPETLGRHHSQPVVDLDVLERRKKIEQGPPAKSRDGAPVPLFLAGHDPLRVLRERKWKEDWAC